MLTLTDKIGRLTAENFTGKVHVVWKNNSQHIGEVSLEEGFLVGGRYRERTGLPALLDLALDDGKAMGRLSYMVEPEVIPPKERELQMTYKVFLKELHGRNRIKKQDLKPPGPLKLLVREEFLSEHGLSGPELGLLKVISRYTKVVDIYKNSNNAGIGRDRSTRLLAKERSVKSYRIIGNIVMKSQKHNGGELKELTVKIEKNVVDSLMKMSKGSGISIDDLVVIALKRFRASHSDYEGKAYRTE